MLVDLHLKTSRSAGVTFSAQEVVQKAKSVGLDAVAFCDTLATSHAQELLNVCNAEGMTGFVGVEIPTTEGVLLCFAPTIDEFYASEEWRRLTELATPAASLVVDLFAERGGVVFASRPYDLDVAHNMGDLIFKIKGLHGVEVFNSRVRPIQADFAIEAADAMNLPTAGGTALRDSLSEVGMFATLFTSAFKTQADFVEAIKGGEFYGVAIGTSPIRNDRPERPERSERPERGSDRNGRGGRGTDRRGGGGNRDRGRGGNDRRR